jgi:hypothetical protein
MPAARVEKKESCSSANVPQRQLAQSAVAALD